MRSYNICAVSCWSLDMMWKSGLLIKSAVSFQAADNGMINTVCTLYELVNGDDTVDQGYINIFIHSLLPYFVTEMFEMINEAT
jgi:ESCRT-II complex subunit